MSQSVRAQLSNLLVGLARAGGLNRSLQKLPWLYSGLRRMLVMLVGRGNSARRIMAGPLAGQWLVLGPHDRNAYLVNEHEPAMVEQIGGLCRPGMRVLDVGAHVGYFSLLMAARVGASGHVFTIEPNPANVAKIRATIAANALKHITLFPFAAAAQPGELNFAIEATGQMGHIVEKGADAHGETIKVQVETIDRLAEQHGFGKIDFVKMDVEGAERHALAGMRGLLTTHGPTILCEWHPQTAGEGAEAFFATIGYRAELLEPASAVAPFHVLARPV